MMSFPTCESVCDWCEELLHNPQKYAEGYDNFRCMEGSCMEEIAETMDTRFMHAFCYEKFLMSEGGLTERQSKRYGEIDCYG